jgi:hypothetical protein
MASAPQRFSDRRSNHRYPVNAAIDYKIVLRNRMVLTGVGRTVNISSGGILLDTPNCLPNGVEIELSMAWPASLNGVAALKMHVVGRTVRAQGNCTAVVIRRYEFRTRGKLSSERQLAMISCAQD